MGRRRAYGRPSGDRRAQARTESVIESNPVTMIAGALVVGFLIGTPQVRLILFDLPPLGSLGLGEEGRRAVALWLYFGVVVSSYAVVVLTLLDRRPIEEQVSGPISARGIRGFLVRTARRLRELVIPIVALLLLRPAARMSPNWRRVLGVVLFIPGVVLALPAGYHVEPEFLASVDRALQALAGSVGAAVGLWLFFARLPNDPGRPKTNMPRERAMWDHTVRLGTLVGRALELLILASILGECIWWILGHTEISTGTGWRAYTLWASLHFSAAMIVFGRIADAAGRKTWSRVAIGALMATAFYGIGAALVPVGEVRNGTLSDSAVPPATADEPECSVPDGSRGDDVRRACALTDAWFDQVERRLAGIPADEPVLFVAASGGGARAAIWATYVLEALERTPVHEPLESPPQVELVEEGRALADRVLFISGVSGGSVGSAHFVLGESPEEPPPPPHNVLVSQLEEAFHEEKGRVCAKDEFKAEPRCLPGSPDLFSPTLWPVNSVRIDEMSTDFNAPALRGIVMPGIERGESVTYFWEDHFGWNQRKVPGGPLLLLNSTEVQTGLRLVSGEPSLPPGLLWDAGMPERQELRPEWSPGEFRAAVYWSGLEDPDGRAARAITDIHPALDVSVSEAVRMSANFPWGFDLPRLNVDVKLPAGRRAEEPILVVDGGVLDNTGIDSFSAMIGRLHYLADGDSEQIPARLAGRAADLLDELADRGVVLLEIDSGTRPDQPGLMQRLFDSVTMPLHALSEAGFVRQTKGTERDVHQMRLILGERSARRVADSLREAARGEFAHFVTSPGPGGSIGRGIELPEGEPAADSPTDPVEEPAAVEEGELPDRAASRSGDGATVSAAFESVISDLVGMRVAHLRYTANHRDNIMTGWALSPEQRGVLLLRFLLEDDRRRAELVNEWLELRGENRTIGVLRDRAEVEGAAEGEDLVPILRLVGELSRSAEELATEENRSRMIDLARRDAAWRSGLDLSDSMRAGLEEQVLSGAGFIFLGFHEPAGEEVGDIYDGDGDDAWLTYSVDLDRRQSPKEVENDIRRTLGRIHLREGMPDEEGRLPAVLGELPLGTEVRLKKVDRWRDTGFWFAEVEVEGPPQAEVAAPLGGEVEPPGKRAP